MRRWLGLALAGVLALAVVSAIVVSAAQKLHPTPPLTVVHGVIGSEKLLYFQRFGGSSLKLPSPNSGSSASS